MMRLVICQLALVGLSRATRARDMKDEAFAWPWDSDAHHAHPHHLGGSMMAAHAQVHHQRNMFDSSSSDFSSSFSGSSDFSSSSDFSTDSDSGSGGDFMDKYITETGQKPMQVDDDKPKVKKEDDGIPDMATLFGDSPATPQEKPKEQEPWRSSASNDVDNMFSGSFGNFNAPAQASFDAPKPAQHAEESASAFGDDMTKMFEASNFEGSGDRASAPPAPASNSDSPSSDASGWPWDTHAKKDSEGRHSRNLWGSRSDSDSSSSTSSNDMVNMFGGSSSGSSDSSSSKDSGSSRNLFDEWSAFGGSNSGVSQPAHAPQQQNDAPADSPIQGPTQRESSIAGASAHDQVVDVRLSSELQQSLLQARNAESKMLQRFRGVSN